ncbi:DUF805 domain-containing protein [Hymenobacter convexus]|uniref:DUF805 domain-containing protein n=1 Tax=Hymenobacter sp. CA1UV-4 TaxID=3063782 RepID=UPI002712E25D|nr:DUF805 domain-containing protein [Hymenobacter sp. CA1UV-4]MDO7850613.1 DUF805 domain-containing protein [Hymenobacter sp. CA1UV-4]
MDYFLLALKKYAVFSGRARRKEYWMFVLFQFLLSIAAAVIDGMMGSSVGVGTGVLSILLGLALLVPGLAVSVRRLHDVNKSGWFLLIALVPLVGAIWLLVLDVTEGTRGDNDYGPDPKAMELAY